MHLSKEQKRVLVEERRQRLEDSAERARQRAPALQLLQQLLAPRLLQDDGNNMERMFAVGFYPSSPRPRASAWTTLLLSTARTCESMMYPCSW